MFAAAPLVLLFAVAGDEAAEAVSTEKEVSSPSGPSLQASLSMPVSDALGTRSVGYGGAVAYFARASLLAVEPRFRLHYGPGETHYIDMSWDVGLFVLPLEGFVSPIVGGGAGLRYLSTTGPTDRRVAGTIIRSELEETPGRTEVGLNLFARAGVRLVASPKLSVLMHAEYAVAMIDAFDRPTTLVFSLGLCL